MTDQKRNSLAIKTELEAANAEKTPRLNRYTALIGALEQGDGQPGNQEEAQTIRVELDIFDARIARLQDEYFAALCDEAVEAYRAAQERHYAAKVAAYEARRENEKIIKRHEQELLEQTIKSQHLHEENSAAFGDIQVFTKRLEQAGGGQVIAAIRDRIAAIDAEYASRKVRQG